MRGGWELMGEKVVSGSAGARGTVPRPGIMWHERDLHRPGQRAIVQEGLPRGGYLGKCDLSPLLMSALTRPVATVLASLLPS